MNIQEQIRVTEELLEGVKELNGEYQEGWEIVIENAEKLINQLKQGSKLPMHGVSESDLLKMIGSESVRTLLRHGFKSPDRSGTGDCDDTCYIELYRFVNKL